MDMKECVNRFFVKALCKAAAAKQRLCAAGDELREDERGLSGVVVAILLILVAVLAVVLIWQFLGEYLQEVFDRITAADTIG